MWSFVVSTSGQYTQHTAAQYSMLHSAFAYLLHIIVYVVPAPPLWIIRPAAVNVSVLIVILNIPDAHSTAHRLSVGQLGRLDLVVVVGIVAVEVILDLVCAVCSKAIIRQFASQQSIGRCEESVMICATPPVNRYIGKLAHTHVDVSAENMYACDVCERNQR
jgi:hypothetical protein